MFSPSQEQKPTQLLSHSPPPQWDGEENWKEKAKVTGGDKISLTDQQRENTRKLIKRIYRVQYSYCLMLSLLPSSQLPSLGQVPHLNIKHDVTWY